MVDKTTISELEQSAANLIKSQHYSEALPVLQSILILDPNNEEALYGIGITFAQFKRYPEAINAYNRALKINQNNSNLWNYKGIALFELGKYSEAIDSFTQALGISPNDANIEKNKEFAFKKLIEQNEQNCLKKSNESLVHEWNEKGTVLCKLEKYSEAINAFDQALLLYPNDETLKNNKEFAFKKFIEQNEQNRLKKSNESLALDWNEKGIEYFKQEKYAEAITAFDLALKITPNDGTIKNNKDEANKKKIEKSKTNPISSVIFVFILLAIIVFFGVNIVKNINQNNPIGQLQEGEKANSISQAIDYTNPTTIDFALGQVKKTSRGGSQVSLSQVCDIWEYCYNNWVYVKDPFDQDYYSPASRTINRGLKGDCDDFAILIAAVIQSIGGRSRVVTACSNQGDCHAYAEVFVSTDWDTFQANAASICTRYHCKSVYYHSQLNSQGNTEYWLNLDWSAYYPGGKLFNDDGTYHVYYTNGFHETLTHTGPYPQ